MDAPGKDHVLLVDEINRGNLPKILGELLYLLEYREEEVTLMYGEDGERNKLPENLFIIGTMNTADRSITLLDAARDHGSRVSSAEPAVGRLRGI